MDGTPILDERWPTGLDSADVPFRTRTVTVLTRQGYFDDPSLFDTLSESEVLRNVEVLGPGNLLRRSVRPRLYKHGSRDTPWALQPNSHRH